MIWDENIKSEHQERMNPLTSFVKASKPIVPVTDGTGYKGSHTVVVLIVAGYNPVIIDNLSNSKVSVLERIAEITEKRPPFYKIDLCGIAHRP